MIDNTTTPSDGAANKQPWYRKTWVIVVAVVFVLLVILGSVTGPSDAEVSDARAEASVAQKNAAEAEAKVVALEKEVSELEAREPETVEVEKVVEKTPKACLNALDEADTGFLLAGDAFFTVSEIFDALANGDLSTLESASVEFGRQAEEIEPQMDKYAAASGECRKAS